MATGVGLKVVMRPGSLAALCSSCLPAVHAVVQACCQGNEGAAGRVRRNLPSPRGPTAARTRRSQVIRRTRTLHGRPSSRRIHSATRSRESVQTDHYGRGSALLGDDSAWIPDVSSSVTSPRKSPFDPLHLLGNNRVMDDRRGEHLFTPSTQRRSLGAMGRLNRSLPRETMAGPTEGAGMDDIRFQLLGPMGILVDGVPAKLPGSGRARPPGPAGSCARAHHPRHPVG